MRLLILLLFFSTMSYAQKNDSLNAMRVMKLFEEYEYTDTSKARIYADSLFFFARRSENLILIGRAHQYKGWYFEDQSIYKSAKEEFILSLTSFREAKFEQGIADAYGNLGNVFLEMGDIAQSLDYQLKSLNHNERILTGNLTKLERKFALQGKTYALHNIASIYADLDLHQKALEYEYRSLAAELEAGNKIGAAISYASIATGQKELGNVDSAVYYFNMAIQLYKKEKYYVGLPLAYYTLASMNGTGMTSEEKAKLVLEGLRIHEKAGDRDGIVHGLLGLVEFQFDELSTDSIGLLLKRAENLIEKYELDHDLEDFYRLYSKYSERIRDYRKALIYLERHLELKEKTDEEKQNQDILTADLKYEIQLKSFNDSLHLAERYALKREKDQRKIAEQRSWISLGVLGGSILLGSLFFFIYSNNRKRRLNEFLSEKNSVINHQKDIVDEKNKSISSSIAYAQRLQAAILPKRSEIEGHFPESFLIFRPKDLVSGDFYWFETYGDLVYIAAADCTGHGVPGAMVSVVCSNALSRVLKEFGITEPSKILARTRELVMETFGRSDEHVEDGMDISLCAINKSKNEVVFAGANNPLWIVRRNQQLNESTNTSRLLKGESHSLLEFKGDKQPVGPYPKMGDFTDHTIQISKGDTLYLLSDGFADQFGGEEGKKFMTPRLKKELLIRGEKTLNQQETEIEELFLSWMNQHEQVDEYPSDQPHLAQLDHRCDLWLKNERYEFRRKDVYGGGSLDVFRRV